MQIHKDLVLTHAINQACTDPATKIVAEFPELDREKVSSTLKKIIEFVQDNVSNLNGCSFALKLDLSNSGPACEKLSIDSIKKATSQNLHIFVINQNLEILSFGMLQLTDVEIASFSQEQKACVIHIYQRTEIKIYVNGRPVKYINALLPLSNEPMHTIKRIPAHNYRFALMEHYQKIRFGGPRSDHWADREKRILRASPTKTEKMLQNNLWVWLDDNLDGAHVLAEVQKITQDRTDIEIRTLDGPVYILEIKWLGKNQNSMEYKEDRIREGITQVNNYIATENYAKEVCLVVYDARNKAEFNALPYQNCEPDQWKEIIECGGCRFNNPGLGYVFYLENKSASTRGM